MPFLIRLPFLVRINMPWGVQRTQGGLPDETQQMLCEGDQWVLHCLLLMNEAEDLSEATGNLERF